MGMNIVTVAGMALSACRDYGAPMVYDQNSLLNTSWNVLPNDRPAAGVYPQRCGIMVGNGGRTFSSGIGGIPLGMESPRSRGFTALYSAIPFIVRPVSSDLTSAQRANYSGRTLVTVLGVQYAVYWVLNVDFSQAALSRQVQTIVNGVVTSSTDFTNQPSDLKPVAPVVSQANLNQVTNTYVTTTLPVNIQLSSSACQEIVNACKILYGDANYAVIRELGVISGVKKAITLPDSTQFNELMVAQLVSVHTGLQYELDGSSENVGISINGGGALPLTMITSAPTT